MRGTIFRIVRSKIMILAIDIGNTNITFGVFKDDELVLVSRLATERNRTDDQYAFEFLNIFKMNNIKPTEISGAVLSSVVPELTRIIKYAVQKVNGVLPLTLAPGVKTGLNILIDDPAELGADLAAGAVGTVKKYQLPAFVIDLGTATKMYAVDDKSGFHGGMIAPGIEISMKALTGQTSLLPSISLGAPPKACGTNTVECLQSGIIFGTADMIDGMIDRFSAQLGEPATIVATGGLSFYITGVCKHKIIFDPDLLLYGLKSIYDKNIK